jgi:hypothetical protein
MQSNAGCIIQKQCQLRESLEQDIIRVSGVAEKDKPEDPASVWS